MEQSAEELLHFLVHDAVVYNDLKAKVLARMAETLEHSNQQGVSKMSGMA